MKEEPTRIGRQGWRQFLTGRKKILDAYDAAREQARAHEVEVFHGTVVEAEFRAWLGEFLPKRYAVTAGYVVSQGTLDDEKAPHFDVIVYDRMESPVLWVERSPDVGEKGEVRAIPAEHVLAVLEVKSALTRASARLAIEHLCDLAPLYEDLDKPGERYPKYLPFDFTCGCIFAEAREECSYDRTALSLLVGRPGMRGYHGALILRGEGVPANASGYAELVLSETPIESSVGLGKESLFKAPFADTIEVGPKSHLGAFLSWSEVHFSRYAFDLLASIRGRKEMGRAPTFHGMSWLNPKRKRDTSGS